MTNDDVITAQRVLWVTGAGSGVGRATAIAAASAGWWVVASGRRVEQLDSTVHEIRSGGGIARSLPLDVRDGEAVRSARQDIVDGWGRIDSVLLSAGLNAPRRRWADQSMDEFRDILDTNLTATATVIDAVLPDLRERHGSVVVVSSQSAWQFNAGAGVAYGASKAGLSALCRTLNNQERHAGVRACCLYPGDVATEFLQHRPAAPDETARSVMLSAQDVARAVCFVIDSPAHVRFDELVITPVSQA
jgi:NADP-dependent 3-hydroxy acid dehydrogenase YdfG